MRLRLHRRGRSRIRNPELPFSKGNTMLEIDLPRLYERDIDMLLQEELIFNKAVRSVFSRALNIPDHVEITRCGLSVVDTTGETDLFAVFSAGGRQGAILIENKIDAGFQPLQPE